MITVSEFGQWLFDAMDRTVEAAGPGRMPVMLVRKKSEADLVVLRLRDYGALNNPFARSPSTESGQQPRVVKNGAQR